MFVKDDSLRARLWGGETQETHMEAFEGADTGSGQPRPARQTVLRTGDSVS